jgi:hypothetical protein
MAIVDLVFHYTTIEGLLGILKSRSFFATHIRYLNDRSELEHGRRILLSFLADKQGGAAQATSPVSVSPKELTNFLVSLILEQLDDSARIGEIYSVSFCGAKDQYEFDNGLLSQWRAYGTDGGVCIGLSRSKLKTSVEDFGKLAGITGLTLEQVTYSESVEDVSAYLENEYGKIAATIENNALSIHKVVEGTGDAKGGSPELVSLGESNLLSIVGSLFKLLPLIKHVGFHEEKETRILLWGNTLQEMHNLLKLREFRMKGSILAPYIAVGCGNLVSLERILVGPHMEQDRRVRAVEAYTRSLGYKVEVRKSATPALS